jgi:hypothetical protein
VIASLSGRLAAALAGAAVLLVVLVGWFVLVSPQRSKAASLATNIQSTQAQVESTQAYVDNPATKKAVHDLKRLKKVLPDDPKVSQILRQLSTAAAASGIALTTTSPGAAVASSGGEAVPVSLSVNGHYVNLERFLHLLRTQVVLKGADVKGSGRLYAVESIAFSGGGATTSADGTSGASSGSAPLTASIALDAFVYATPAAVPATTTPTDTTTTSP